MTPCVSKDRGSEGLFWNRKSRCLCGEVDTIKPYGDARQCLRGPKLCN